MNRTAPAPRLRGGRFLCFCGGFDAWGNHKIYNAAGVDISNPTGYTEHVGRINPFRYRGYYYDDQLGMYYLKSRFYDPKVKRFISPDDLSYLDPETVNGLNLYAYCRNNPVMYADPSGHIPIILAVLVIGAAVGAVSYTASAGVSYAMTGSWDWSWGRFAGETLGGAIGGLLSLTGAKALTLAFSTGFISSALGMVFENAFEEDHTVMEIIGISFLDGIASMMFSKLADMIRVPKITSGRNSYGAIAKQVITKFRRGMIKNITAKTMRKMAVYNLLGEIWDILFEGIQALKSRLSES